MKKAVSILLMVAALTGVSRAESQTNAAVSNINSRGIMASWTNELTKTILIPTAKKEVKVPTTKPLNREAEKLVDQAYLAVRAMDYEKAIRVFEEAMSLDPKNKRARFGVSSIYIEQGRFGDALAYLEEMVSEYPEDYMIKNNIAWLYATAKDHAIRNSRKAVSYAQSALMDNPDDFHVWSTLAEAYYVGTQYDKAVRAATEAYELAKRQGAGDAAVEEYRKQLEKCTKAARAMSILE